MVHQPLDLPASTPYSDSMVLLCNRLKGLRWVSTYLSPLDAVLGAKSLSQGEYFWPLDFQRVDTRTFIRENRDWLNVSICYAFAADRGHLVVNEQGHPLMIITGDRFRIPDAGDHFSLRFADRAARQINSVYARAGLSNFGATIDEMERWSRERIAEAEQEALDNLPPTVSWVEAGKTSMKQCAIYDPETMEWLFVDF